MDSQLTEVFTSTATDLSWVGQAHSGFAVELEVYGARAQGVVESTSRDSMTVRIPVDQQSEDMRRFSTAGTAVISLDHGAARVPVLVQSLGEQVRLQFIGRAEIVQRRRYVRIQVQFPVKVRWREGEDRPWLCVDSRTQDLSLGGVRVADTKVVWPSKGQRVRLTLELPSGPIEEKATVVGLTPSYDLRLSFDGLSPLGQHWLQHLFEPE